MADPRTFVLIGDFQDNITPALEGINNSIAGLKRTMSTMTSKRGGGFSDVTQSIGKLVSAQKHLADSIKEVGNQAKEATSQLRDYKQVIGQVNRAHHHLAKASGMFAKNEGKMFDSLSEGAKRYKRELSGLGESRRRIRRPDSPYSGGAPQAPRSLAPSERRVRGGGGGGGSGGPGRDDFPFERFTLAMGVAQGIGQPIESAIVSGFQIGVQLMMTPFQYFANAFGERVQDQISDLKSAGALYSISKRSKNPFLKDIDEAIEFQQQTNATFANLAKDLPGVTNDYVQVGKRLSDTAARIVTQDFGGALKFAQEIREKEGGKYYGTAEALTKMSGAEQQREVIETILGNLTKKATLGGMGNRSGAGGISGAYGLPGIIERLVSEDEVSVAKFQRYASVFSDPAIADALARNVDKINATAKNSVERARMLDKVLDEIVTPEMIEKLRISVDGIYQGLRSMFLDPDTGLFGLGRQFTKIGRKMNSYGQYLNEVGDVVTSAEKAARVDLSIFEILADIFAQFGQVLMPIVEVLPLVFDPLEKLAKTLLDARHYGAELNRTFNMYRDGLEKLAKQPGFAHVKDFKDVRASLLAIGNIVRAFGGISTQQFEDLSKQVTSKDFEKNIGPIVTNLMNQLMNSQVAENIGKMIGSIVGSVLVEVAKVTGFFSKRLKSSNKLFDGLKRGFDEVGGAQAFANIFRDIFTMMFDALIYLLPKIPIEAYIIGALVLTIPIAIQTFAMKLGHMISNAFFGSGGKGLLAKCMPKNLGCSVIPGGKNKPGKPGMPGGVVTRPSSHSRTAPIPAIASPAVGPKPPKGFEHVALPGSAPPIYGVTPPPRPHKPRSPGLAPSVPKPVVPLKRQPLGFLSQLKAKAVAPLAAAVIAMTTKAPALAKGAKAVTTFAKSVPGIGLAFTGLDFAVRKAAGDDTAKAAGGAVGAGVGGVIGGALGSFIPVPGGTFIGAAIGAWLGDWIGQNIGPMLAELPGKLSSMWEGFKTWIVNLPANLMYSIGALQAQVEMGWSNFTKWWVSLGPKFDKAVDGFIVNAQNFFKKAVKFLSSPSEWMKLGQALLTGFGDMINSVKSGISNWWKGIQNWGRDIQNMRETGYRETINDYTSTQTQQRQIETNEAWRQMLGLTTPPPPPKNEQEGLPLSRFSSKNWGEGCSISGSMGSNTVGGVDAFNSIARAKGLSLTSGFRPGSKGWHGVNRARDYSNGSSPTPQMMAFAQKLINDYGGNLKELIYTPLGFSIKDGKKVPPIAASSHFNHVHVAYALGAGNPILAPTKAMAEEIDARAFGRANIKTFTAGNGEFGGGPTINGGINVTVNGSGISDPQELAAMVAWEIQQAMESTDPLFV